MNRSPVILHQIARVDRREGNFESVKQRGRKLRRRRQSIYSILALAVLVGVFSTVLLQPATTAVAGGGYTPEQRFLLISCFQEHGLEAVAQSDGTVLVSHGNSERSNVQKVAGICVDIVDGTATAPEEDVRSDYEYRLEERDCLLAAGYTVAAPPTWETYLAQYGDGDQNNDWFPIEHVAGEVPLAEIAKQLGDCHLDTYGQ